jgi:signal transduction histidine kinase
MKSSAGTSDEIVAKRGERTATRRYAAAVLASVVALAVTALLRPWLGHTMYLFVYPAVMLAAWYGGFLAGALTAIVCGFGASYLFMEPVGSFRADDPAAAATVGVLVWNSWLVDRLSRAAEKARTVALFRAVQAEELARSLEEQAVELEMQVQENRELVAEQERANERLRRAAVEAQAASRAKSAFLATMSHELRTPLNAIDGYAELMQLGIYGTTSDQQLEAIARIRTSHDVLLTLVDQVIDQARIEAGKLQLEREAVPLASVIPATCALVQPLARSKEIEVVCGPVAAEAAAEADPVRVEQILVNLLTNAVKFTGPGGRVTISCEQVDHRVDVHVRDTGPGIPADKLEAIFEPFYQVDQSTTRIEGGAGLGLTISRNLAKAMGGGISVSSHVGEGSTFTLTLPRATVEE